MLQPVDARALLPNYRSDGRSGRASDLQPWTEGLYWSAPSGMGGQLGCVGPGCDAGSDRGYWEPIFQGAFNDSGGGQQKKIIGYTLDSTGAALGNCIVQGFVTATEVFVAQVTSDAAGYYELPTPYTGAHYIVAYKSGSPDVAGTSVNTLTPV